MTETAHPLADRIPLIARAGSDTLEPVQLEKDVPFADDTGKLLREFIASLDCTEPHPAVKRHERRFDV